MKRPISYIQFDWHYNMHPEGGEGYHEIVYIIQKGFIQKGFIQI